jgi:hypothetical protein
MSAWRKANQEGYPVILDLNVAGLEPKPDVDAMLQGYEGARSPETIRSIKECLAGKDPLVRLYDLAEEERDYQNVEATAGDPVEAFIFERYPLSPVVTAMDVMEDQPDAMLAMFRAWADKGVVPDKVIMAMVDQERYMQDFDLDRLLQVRAFRPWWDRVLEPFEWADDSQAEQHAKAIDKAGWHFYTFDDIAGGDVSLPLSKTLYESKGYEHGVSGKGTEPRYHGTLSTAVELAFPGLIPAKPVFRVTEPNFEDDEG